MKKMQHGATLIELMISMALSLSLIAGLTSLFTQVQKSNKSQLAISEMMDDSRYALEILQKELRYTGGLRSASDVNGTKDKIFLDLVNLTTANTLPASPAPTLLGKASPYGFLVQEHIRGDNSNPAPTFDSFMIRYQLVDQNDLNAANPSNSNSPCTQNVLIDPTTEDPATQVHVVTVRFYVSSGQLMCTAQRVIVNPLTGSITCVKNCALADAPAPLIGNIQSISAKYGVDTDSDESANYYVSALDVSAAQWPSVLSIRLNIVLKSSNTHLTSTAVSYSIDDVATTPTDNAIYRVFSTTIAFRNRIGG